MKKFQTINSSERGENFLKSCRPDSSNLLQEGYIFGLATEKELSPVGRDHFSIICYKLEDYNRSFDLIAEAMKSRHWSESDLDRLRSNMSMSASHVLERYSHYPMDRVCFLMNHLDKRRREGNGKVTLTMTMCKRYDLFRKTVCSFLNCCLDLDMIDQWIVVDDNSSEEDRMRALKEFPFIDFVWKGTEDKGHPRSMNIIRRMVKTPFVFHLEDDWLFYRKERYISICLDVLQSDTRYGQCLLNRSYGEREKCHDLLCPSHMRFSNDGHRFYEHTHYTGNELQKFMSDHQNTRNCVYWPHYSLRVGMTRREVFDRVGEFNEKADHFEMEYANRYVSNGYKTVFLDNVYCYHTGRCTFERGSSIKNAYDLNGESQFTKKTETSTSTTTSTLTTTTSSNLNQTGILSLTEEEKRISPFASSLPPRHNNAPPPPPPQGGVNYRVKTVVVNLEKREDRKKKFNEDNGQQIGQLQYSFLKATDGQTMQPLPKILKLFETGDYNYRKGIVGCAHSHLRLWVELAVSQLDVMLVFEDDVTLAPNFLTKFVSCLQNLPPDWDILFLGHSLYPHLKKPGDREDKMPTIEKWSGQKASSLSMGGFFGYAIRKSGAEKGLKHLHENGMHNAIDWIFFRTKDINSYYCYPHLVYTNCVTHQDKPDSNIQYDYSSLCENDSKRLELELNYWKNRGVNPIVVKHGEMPSRDQLLTNVYFIETEKYLDVIKSLQNYPLEFYTLKGKYVVSIPITKIDDTVVKEVVLDGSYLNLNSPV